MTPPYVRALSLRLHEKYAFFRVWDWPNLGPPHRNSTPCTCRLPVSFIGSIGTENRWSAVFLRDPRIFQGEYSIRFCAHQIIYTLRIRPGALTTNEALRAGCRIGCSVGSTRYVQNEVLTRDLI